MKCTAPYVDRMRSAADKIEAEFELLPAFVPQDNDALQVSFLMHCPVPHAHTFGVWLVAQDDFLDELLVLPHFFRHFGRFVIAKDENEATTVSDTVSFRFFP